MSSPAVPDPPGSVWTRFPLDPRSSGDLRAGDSDRDIAREILTEAYADGRIDRLEYDQRIEGAIQAHHLGQLVPILNDVSVAPAGQRSTQPQPPAPQPHNRSQPKTRASGKGRRGAVRTAVFVVGVTNLVWVFISISAGQLTYYWPMWPALGMVIMLLAVFMFRQDPQEPEQRRRDGRRRDGRGKGSRELE